MFYVEKLFQRKFMMAVKYIVISLVTAILVMLIMSSFAKQEYAISIFLSCGLLAIVLTYLTNYSIPMKFFLPGMFFLFAFVVGPVLYTIAMSGFHYQTGNYITKQESISKIIIGGTRADPDQTTFDIVIGKNASDQLEILASDPVNKHYFLSTVSKRIDLDPSTLRKDENGDVAQAPGFRGLTPAESHAIDSTLATIRFTYSSDYFITIEGSNVASLKRQTLIYSESKDSFTNVLTGDVYTDNGVGNYANTKNRTEILQPGWRAPIWFSNYSKLLTDPQVRKPLIKVFIWTISFAFLTVLTQFALGLLIAVVMNRKLFGRRIYRSIIILPYAMPSIMSILIWGGMFDTEFGAINHLFGTHIHWFQNPLFARAAVIIVNLWLGFPYFYLITSGALQAIPAELSEAAAIDGASPGQVFRKITLPLLLQVVSPLLVASFAFNFNNFNIIYLLTGGGPTNTLGGDIAGSTDILISYTYKIAFNAGIQNLGLASAISVVIFLIVASISLYGIKRSKVLDSFA
jgi:arabinogalactan oligomer/maltooligosaccharide transport system permease protein